MTRDEILRELKELRDPQALKLSTYSKYLEDAIEFIRKTSYKKAPYQPNYVEIKWLQRKIIDDMVDGKCDGLVLRMLNYYIYLYEREHDAGRL